ncbi:MULTISPECIES: tetratricopeptide repeat protein [Bradyrhizobium]|uniref:Tetratricopeptide repeat protein n=1 Tax=Bradyrhizobium septentrionale TaxID=1404411 RepID=A0A973W6T5_9BRAD|nr:MULTISPECIES: hypothetical protein [Bradyrhizobium]MCK7667456.1 hypothetical protein [Bradyrhizobium sp. 2S1]QIG94454.1 hypothetical protein G6P99_19610 [Bradyrhizobium sp. 6(2017)]UGY16906.1 hypothetical protein HAP48_0005265 [Bradyrhizobium septentrionale]UGY25670.1 hypothetical protein HU675_0002075 [Bradyrhizobium septentrionale]
MKPFFPRLNHGPKLGDLLPAAPSIPVFLIVLVLMAVSLSALLVPRGSELALLELEAGNTQVALNLLEQMFEAGDRSPPTVAALAKVRARSGDVAGSIRLLIGQLDEHPRDIGLMRLLAGQYRQLGRTDDCADILVRVKAQHPTAEVRRELVRTYLQIVEVELRRGRGHKAVAALRQTLPFRFAQGRPPELSHEPELLHPSVLVDVARAYIRLGLVHENWAVMDALLRQQPSAEAEMAWALAAAGAGRASELFHWLQARKVGSIKPEFLKEITFLAYHAKAHSVAADAARRLVAARGNDSDRMLMAEVFTAAGLSWLGASSRRSLTVSP